MTHPGEGLSEERHARGQSVIALDRALPRAGAHAHGVRFDLHEFQSRDLVDVDEPCGAHQAHRHHRHEALAAGEDLRFIAVAAKQFAGFDRGCGAGVLEGGGFQVAGLASARNVSIARIGAPSSKRMWRLASMRRPMILRYSPSRASLVATATYSSGDEATSSCNPIRLRMPLASLPRRKRPSTVTIGKADSTACIA